MVNPSLEKKIYTRIHNKVVDMIRRLIFRFNNLNYVIHSYNNFFSLFQNIRNSGSWMGTYRYVCLGTISRFEYKK